MAIKYFVVLTTLFAVTTAEVAYIGYCNDVVDACHVSEVRIYPCGNFARRCVTKKGQNATISVDFTPTFAASRLKTGLYWASDMGDTALPILPTSNGCAYTHCPTAPGWRQQMTYNLHVKDWLPSGQYVAKWKIWNEENKAQVCCAQTTIEIED